MQLCLILILLLGLHTVGADLQDSLDTLIATSRGRSSGGPKVEDVMALYEEYKEKFSRGEMTPSEEEKRFRAFNESVMTILQHSRGRAAGSFELGLNKFSDCSDDELAQVRGLKVTQEAFNESLGTPGERLLTWGGNVARGRASLPASFDYTERVVTGTSVSVVRPIKNQGGCGSCWAFAFVALLEFQHAVQVKSEKNLSEQQMVDCSSDDYGCNGGYITNTFPYLQRNLYQVDSGASYPYLATQKKCSFKGATGGGVKFSPLVYRSIKAGDATAMQEALVNYGPLYVSVFVGDSTTSTYKSIQSQFYSVTTGVFAPSGCPTSVYSTNHAVVIVGYGVDSKSGLPYWKVRNSWDTDWGDKGYFKIRRGVNMCGIESGAFYIARSA